MSGAAERFLQYLIVERGLAANTVESYDRDLRRYADFLAGRGREDLAHVLNLAVRDASAQDSEDSTGNQIGIDLVVTELPLDQGETLLVAQQIDGRRLARVRASSKGNFGLRGGRQITQVIDGRKEAGLVEQEGHGGTRM